MKKLFKKFNIELEKFHKFMKCGRIHKVYKLIDG